MLEGRRVLLCVGGGIAAYKAAALTSTLVQRGAIVDVIMTEAATHFVGTLTFSALTARPVYTSLWDAPERIPHIRLVREAHAVLAVPATADLIARAALGRADDLAATALLAARVPVVAAPAMNDAMYLHETNQAHLRTLADRGWTIVEPERGFLAEREHGVGRLAPEERIIEALEAVLARGALLAGKRVIVTAGPTREPFDPVRYTSNPSTGATGIAIAREAAARGASVTLVLGPTHLPPPAGVETIAVRTAVEMRDAAVAACAGADLIVATAAVADWRPAETTAHKVKKSGSDLTVRMVPNPDVLAEMAQHARKAFTVGFAAETQAHETNAREKLARKAVDAIAVNDVGGERGWGAVRNRLTLLWGTDGRRDLGEAEKDVLASRLLDAVEELMRVRRD